MYLCVPLWLIFLSFDGGRGDFVELAKWRSKIASSERNSLGRIGSEWSEPIVQKTVAQRQVPLQEVEEYQEQPPQNSQKAPASLDYGDRHIVASRRLQSRTPEKEVRSVITSTEGSGVRGPKLKDLAEAIIGLAGESDLSGNTNSAAMLGGSDGTETETDTASPNLPKEFEQMSNTMGTGGALILNDADLRDAQTAGAGAIAAGQLLPKRKSPSDSETLTTLRATAHASRSRRREINTSDRPASTAAHDFTSLTVLPPAPTSGSSSLPNSTPPDPLPAQTSGSTPGSTSLPRSVLPNPVAATTTKASRLTERVAHSERTTPAVFSDASIESSSNHMKTQQLSSTEFPRQSDKNHSTKSSRTQEAAALVSDLRHQDSPPRLATSVTAGPRMTKEVAQGSDGCKEVTQSGAAGTPGWTSSNRGFTSSERWFRASLSSAVLASQANSAKSSRTPDNAATQTQPDRTSKTSSISDPSSVRIKHTKNDSVSQPTLTRSPAPEHGSVPTTQPNRTSAASPGSRHSRARSNYITEDGVSDSSSEPATSPSIAAQTPAPEHGSVPTRNYTLTPRYRVRTQPASVGQHITPQASTATQVPQFYSAIV